VNNPAITIAVILDSAQGLHQGGQVSAPVFQRIAQQVLEYVHAPHDLELKNQTQRLTLMASAKNDDAAEEASDRLGAPLIPDWDDASSNGTAKADQHGAKTANPPQSGGANVVEASAGLTVPPSPSSPAAGHGTVVLNVDSGIVVPSFMGKTLRSAVEVAQQSGLEINVLGSGIARQQSPPPGSHLLAGQKVTIRFSH
jgi:cell division protein FtsI (penicillin-binding protein 3)